MGNYNPTTQAIILASSSNLNLAQMALGTDFTVEIDLSKVGVPTENNLNDVQAKVKTAKELQDVSLFRVANMWVIPAGESVNYNDQSHTFSTDNEAVNIDRNLKKVGAARLGAYLRAQEPDAEGKPPAIENFKFKVLGHVFMYNRFSEEENEIRRRTFTQDSYKGYKDFDTEVNAIPDVNDPENKTTLQQRIRMFTDARNKLYKSELKEGVEKDESRMLLVPVMEIAAK